MGRSRRATDAIKSLSIRVASGKVNVGVLGASQALVLMTLIKKENVVDLNLIPYKGGGPLNQDILAELNKLIPSAQLVPPAGWMPRAQREPLPRPSKADRDTRRYILWFGHGFITYEDVRHAAVLLLGRKRQGR